MAFMPATKIVDIRTFLDVCKKYWVDFLPSIRNLNIGFEDSSLNSVIYAILWCSLLFGTVYYYFQKLLVVLLRSIKVKRFKWRPTVQTTWNICFFLASVFVLDFHHTYFLAPQIQRETGRYFPKYENALFLLSDDSKRFNTITLILITFYLVTAVIDFKAQDFSEMATKILYGCVLFNFYYLGYENFSVILNINVGVFSLITECISLFALHTSENSDALFKFYVVLRFLSWSYIYLTLLPFKYLIPTLYAKNFKFWLNIFFWLWYGSSVWNSPLLQFFHHQIFHINPTDCIGGTSVTRCILLKDSLELRHYNNLQKAVFEVKQAHERQTKKRRDSGGESASAKTLQSIKCIMLLKRKLKRMRENKAAAEAAARNDMPDNEVDDALEE